MGGNRRAVIVGINEYADKKIEGLSGAVNDATELYELLHERGDFIIDDKRHFLVDKRATGERIRRAISDLFWKTEECEIALFYFGGHGKVDHLKNGFLLPHDVKCDEPFVRGIHIQELKRLFVRAQPKATGLMILDCCYSGIATETERGGSDAAKHVESFYSDLSLESTGSGRFILASADSDKTAREAEREHALGSEKHCHGLFSFHLIEGLRGGAGDEASRVSLGDLVRYLERVFSDDNLKNKPRLGVDAGTDMHRIFLAEITEDREKHIQARLSEVQRYLEDKRPPALMLAVQGLSNLQEKGLWCDKAGPLLENVNNGLEQLRPQIVRWWQTYSLQIYQTTAPHSNTWYDEIRIMFRDFDYDSIRLLDRHKLAFLCDAIQEIVDGKDHKSIVRSISIMERDSRRILGKGDAIGGQGPRS